MVSNLKPDFGAHIVSQKMNLCHASFQNRVYGREQKYFLSALIKLFLLFLLNVFMMLEEKGLQLEFFWILESSQNLELLVRETGVCFRRFASQSANTQMEYEGRQTEKKMRKKYLCNQVIQTPPRSFLIVPRYSLLKRSSYKDGDINRRHFVSHMQPIVVFSLSLIVCACDDLSLFSC